MKTINKQSWQYKFINWNFTFHEKKLPKNTCSFYFYLIVSFLVAPINAYGIALDKLICLADLRIAKREAPEEYTNVWERAGFNLIGVIIAFFINMFINMGLLYMLNGFKQLGTDLTHYCFVAGFFTCFLYAFLVGATEIIVKKIKRDFCKPIEFQ